MQISFQHHAKTLPIQNVPFGISGRELCSQKCLCASGWRTNTFVFPARSFLKENTGSSEEGHRFQHFLPVRFVHLHVSTKEVASSLTCDKVSREEMYLDAPML